jgi:hypothetical protein
MDKVPVVFTIAELWMLNDFVRHDSASGDQRPSDYPVTSTALNTAIAHAIFSCHEHKQADYTLWLGYGDLLLLDFQVRRDYKTSEGAFGKAILLKVFKAREALNVDSLLEEWPMIAASGGDEDGTTTGYITTTGNNDEDSDESIAGNRD